MSEENRILFVGLGEVGAQAFDLFVRASGRHTFLVAGRDVDHLRQRANLSAFAAMQFGCSPNISHTYMDLENIDQTAETILHFKPDIIFCSATLLKWGAIAALPKLIAEKLYTAQIGPWLPVHLTLVYKLMQAVKLTGLPIKVVNATYPDAVHTILSKVHLSPTTGIGDLANNIPAVKKSIALKLSQPVESVDVHLIAQHHVSYYISRKGHAGGAPFHLAAFINGVDLTHQLSMSKVFNLLPGLLKRAPGNLMTATSAALVFDGLVNDTGKIIHAPGPNGLPGGYPIKVNKEGVQVVLPNGITMEEAVSINTTSQHFDGIEQIDDDGTVHFTEHKMSILRDILGYECKRMPLSEVDHWATELHTKYLTLVKRYQ